MRRSRPHSAALHGDGEFGLVQEPGRLANPALDRRGIRVNGRETRAFASGMRGAVPRVEPETEIDDGEDQHEEQRRHDREFDRCRSCFFLKPCSARSPGSVHIVLQSSRGTDGSLSKV